MERRIALWAACALLAAFLAFVSVEIYRYVERPAVEEGMPEAPPTQWDIGGFICWTVPGSVFCQARWTQVPPWEHWRFYNGPTRPPLEPSLPEGTEG